MSWLHSQGGFRCCSPNPASTGCLAGGKCVCGGLPFLFFFFFLRVFFRLLKRKREDVAVQTTEGAWGIVGGRWRPGKMLFLASPSQRGFPGPPPSYKKTSSGRFSALITPQIASASPSQVPAGVRASPGTGAQRGEERLPVKPPRRGLGACRDAVERFFFLQTPTEKRKAGGGGSGCRVKRTPGLPGFAGAAFQGGLSRCRSPSGGFASSLPSC